MVKPAGRTWLLLGGVVLVAAILRGLLLDNQGLWADEVFSLAMATGHSLEHPAAVAEPDRGDWVESPQPLDPASYRRYLELDDPLASPGRVLRAVRLSDTNPPLYYLLLNLWLRVFGCSDPALKLFSVLFTLACFPLLWILARALGGRGAALPAVVLFAVSPLGLYHSHEGRMYSLVWFLALWLAWSTWKLARSPPICQVSWLAASAAALLTHYFLAFVWGACVLWLWLRRRRRVVFLAAVVSLLVLPWYRLLPESLAGWRVTGGWLRGFPPLPQAVLAPFRAAWGLFSGWGNWGGSLVAEAVLLATYTVIAVVVIRRLGRRVLGPRRRLLLFWLVAVCLGPSLFDVLRQTHGALVPRYTVAGLPAATLLLACLLARLPARQRWAAVLIIVLAWLPGMHLVRAANARHGEAYRETAWRLAEWVTEADLVLVHATPTGVLGIARYLEADVGLVSWVGQLGVRSVPDDVERLVAGRRRVVLVEIHAIDEPAPEEDWLREHAVVESAWRYQRVRAVVFAPPTGERFPAREE